MKRLPPQVSNWNSPAQVKKYFQSIGIPMDSLQQLDDLLPAYSNKSLHLFAEARALYKATTTYGEVWLKDDFKGSTVDPDNRVRADFEQILNTGRFSCSHPNLQQLPRDGMHRSAFVPGKGNVFVIGDFSSQEIGIAAAASKEEVWIKAILRGEDVHSLTATLIATDAWRNGVEKGCTFPKKCKCKAHVQLREHAKVTNFTVIYGGGPGNISKKTKLSMKDAQKLVMKFKRAVPKLTRWLEKNGQETVKTRISYSADPFKRRRTIRDPEDWQLRNVGKNNPIQACGANMTKLAMVSLPEEFPIVLTIHDELVLEVKKSQAGKAVKALKAVMEKAADYCTEVPGLIKVEPRIANSLSK
jgi:DNA polymerase I-like protein with 3'-5' exonuclease and polymerase domains